jgi:DNA-binding transcriptional regulator YhcF (GntR family)
LPTVRQLAIDLGVHPGVVERAYDELERMGVVTTRPGGVYTAVTIPEDQGRDRLVRLERLCREFVARADALGFPLDDVMDMLAELRATRRDTDDEE